MALRIFLVEDNDTVRHALTDMLHETLDCEVVASARSESAATQWLERHENGWDVAVIDLALAQGTGLGVLSACRERQEQQKAVVLTGSADQRIRSQCAALSANAVFDKVSELDLLFAYCCGRDTPMANVLAEH